MYIYWTPKIRRFVRLKREREANSWLQTKKKIFFLTNAVSWVAKTTAVQRWIDDGYFTDEAYFENEFGKNVASGKRLTNRPQNITETKKKCKIQMYYV